MCSELQDQCRLWGFPHNTLNTSAGPPSLIPFTHGGSEPFPGAMENPVPSSLWVQG